VPLILVAVFLGGAVGTGLRFGIDTLFPAASASSAAVDAFPFATLAINVVGSFALGFLVGRVWPSAPHWLRRALGPGLLGGFTTFSAVTLAALTLAPLLAAAYLAASLLGGLTAAFAGLRLGHSRRTADEIGPEQ
jgi:CrcB protein